MEVCTPKTPTDVVAVGHQVMLVCPQCQFQNPSHHNFCQKCGRSLTQKSCGECGSKVPLGALDCPECGARTGTVWLAIVSSLTADGEGDMLADRVENPSVSEEIERLRGAIAEISQKTDSETDIIQADADIEPEAAFDDKVSGAFDLVEVDSSGCETPSEEVWISEAFDASQIPVGDALESPSGDEQEGSVGLESNGIGCPGSDGEMYFDQNRRYQPLEPLKPLKPGETAAVEVLDTQPLQTSPVQAAQPALLLSPEKMDTFVIAAAQVYLMLQSSPLKEHFPKLQDAWESDLYRVVLLENYSNFPMLIEQLSNPQTSPREILCWFQQMANLWETLEPRQLRQSLLEPTNLRVSPDFPRTVRLQRLYPEVPESGVSLSDLGHAWKTWVQQSQRTLFGSLTLVLRDLNEGKIETIDQLQDRLAEVEGELNGLSPQTQQTRTSAPTRIQVDEEDEDTTDIPTEANFAPTVPQVNSLLHLEAAGATDIGRKRQRNEDSFGLQTLINQEQTPEGQIFDAKGLYILCDGMGGHAGGEVASQLAVDTLKQYFQTQLTGELPSRELIEDGIVQANSVIYEANQQAVSSGIGRMGTTLVMAIVVDNQVAIAHVGDSRLYALTSRGIKQVTVDHEVGQREIQRGVNPDVAYARPDAYQLTQALGPRDRNFVKPDVQFLDVKEDTVLILASDGLTDNDLVEIYRESHLDPLLDPQTDLNTGVARLIDLANEHNGHDNITIIAIRMLVSGK